MSKALTVGALRALLAEYDDRQSVILIVGAIQWAENESVHAIVTGVSFDAVAQAVVIDGEEHDDA